MIADASTARAKIENADPIIAVTKTMESGPRRIDITGP